MPSARTIYKRAYRARYHTYWGARASITIRIRKELVDPPETPGGTPQLTATWGEEISKGIWVKSHVEEGLPQEVREISQITDWTPPTDLTGVYDLRETADGWTWTRATYGLVGADLLVLEALPEETVRAYFEVEEWRNNQKGNPLPQIRARRWSDSKWAYWHYAVKFEDLRRFSASVARLLRSNAEYQFRRSQ